MIQILNVSKDEENYIVTIQREDLSTLVILIPIEGIDNHQNRCIAEEKPSDPFGLNFVCDGHYS